MTQQKTRDPIATWGFFKAFTSHLRKETLTRIYGVGDRQVARWAADPSATAENSHAKNPIDKYETLLKEMSKDKECAKIARLAVERQADIVGCRLVRKEFPEPDKETVREECIDDLKVLANYHEVLLDPKSKKITVRNALTRLINELEQNYVRWCRANGVNP